MTRLEFVISSNPLSLLFFLSFTFLAFSPVVWRVFIPVKQGHAMLPCGMWMMTMAVGLRMQRTNTHTHTHRQPSTQAQEGNAACLLEFPSMALAASMYRKGLRLYWSCLIFIYYFVNAKDEVMIRKRARVRARERERELAAACAEELQSSDKLCWTRGLSFF